MNEGRLPEGYFALAENRTPNFVPDVITLAFPDTDTSWTHASDGGNATAVALPKSRFVETSSGRKPKIVGRRRIAIRHARNLQLIAVIEILSPSNKAKKLEFRDLVEKSAQL